MQQRASLCRALIHDPTLLLLDEPFGALDQFTREELWAILQELWMTHKPTVLLVTHDLREAAVFGGTAVLLDGGQIVQQGPIDALVRAPATAFVERFVNAQRDQRSADRGQAGAP